MWATWHHDKPADHHVIISLYKAAAGDVSQLGIGRGIEIVNFDKAQATGIVRSVSDRCVLTRPRQACQDSGFEIVGWSNRAIDNILFIWGVRPVVVGRDEFPGGVT